ncbi:hypothetical protein CWK15_20940 [Salmonella enterica]|uniref:DUF7424 domain-containing protein n=1 Tax=Salmonella enterica TaxID=28901 RepID=A0A5V4Z862_SALER|nr:hypothetical protein [Salmonella enterica]ECE0890424.1 hypothetical protein [Salmonella enterica subsp. diarizonae]EBU3913840.1 hypothetical protein [Salmonella enterica]ECI4613684.1 hypothetical protein [Salmonella enterica subsp. diarizonae]ECI5277948.1 hypothetical protein [Salmonella enterica subsp. diarizonae]
MRKVVILGAVVVSALALNGCKIDMGASIPLSGLLGSELKTGSADLYVEVPACNSYEDSRQPSKGLVDAKNEIAKIIPESEFKECFQKKFNSFASFSVPIVYGPANKVADSTSQIRVLRDTEKNFAYVAFGQKLKQSLDQARKKPSIAGGFSPSDVSLSLNLTNDTDKTITANFVGVYIGKDPVIVENDIEIGAGKVVPLTLSNVTTSMLFSDIKNRSAWFMDGMKQ